MTYDLTQIFNELDLLEIRLNILDSHVDYFVIGQSTQTFSGKDKPLYFDKNEKRWDKWRDKIIDVIMPRVDTDDVFKRTRIQKDSLRSVLNCQPDDTIYYGDIDEIWTPQTEEGKLEQINYCYYLNQRSSELWQGTNVFKYKNIKDLNEIRADHSNILLNGGWHFTSMGGHEQVLKKLEAYDHQEFNTQENRELLKDRIKDNEDYLGRQFDWLGRPFEYWIDESELPMYIKDNKDKWIKLFR